MQNKINVTNTINLMGIISFISSKVSNNNSPQKVLATRLVIVVNKLGDGLNFLKIYLRQKPIEHVELNQQGVLICALKSLYR